MSFLLFNLIQNWNNEYSDKEPYQIIELIDKDHPMRGYSLCDEKGKTDYLPSGGADGKCWYLPANEDTELAFIGEKKWSNGKELFVVTLDPTCKDELKILMDERFLTCK
jgi:hypothetical protein